MKIYNIIETRKIKGSFENPNGSAIFEGENEITLDKVCEKLGIEKTKHNFDKIQDNLYLAADSIFHFTDELLEVEQYKEEEFIIAIFDNYEMALEFLKKNQYVNLKIRSSYINQRV